MRTLLILALFAFPAAAAPPSTCGAADDYSRALCAYQHRNFGEAEKGFRAIVDAAAREPRTVKAMYFLARTLMKTGRFEDASRVLIRIYETDKPFYDDWECDFLLGECRRALGKG
ncbi:MAG TPA: tetratricopeptide repeat protein [Thermoanaerobaculia bacterium]